MSNIDKKQYNLLLILVILLYPFAISGIIKRYSIENNQYRIDKKVDRNLEVIKNNYDTIDNNYNKINPLNENSK